MKPENIYIVAYFIIVAIIFIGINVVPIMQLNEGCPAGKIMVKKAIYGLACVSE